MPDIVAIFEDEEYDNLKEEMQELMDELGVDNPNAVGTIFDILDKYDITITSYSLDLRNLFGEDDDTKNKD